MVDELVDLKNDINKAVGQLDDPKQQLVIKLKYTDRAVPAIAGLKRISKPGLRRYVTCANIPSVLDGMGLAVHGCDMNDSPESRPLRLALGATVLEAPQPQARQESAGTLYNISYLRADRRRPRGTYRYRGQWAVLDQCIVNSRLLDDSNHLHLVREGPVRIISHAFLMEEDRHYGGLKPWRTYQGPFYRGGFSDHLPIVVELEYRHR